MLKPAIINKWTKAICCLFFIWVKCGKKKRLEVCLWYFCLSFLMISENLKVKDKRIWRVLNCSSITSFRVQPLFLCVPDWGDSHYEFLNTKGHGEVNWMCWDVPSQVRSWTLGYSSNQKYDITRRKTWKFVPLPMNFKELNLHFPSSKIHQFFRLNTSSILAALLPNEARTQPLLLFVNWDLGDFQCGKILATLFMEDYLVCSLE